MSRAACYQHPSLPPEAWTVADRGNQTTTSPEANLAAVNVCARCPIATRCLREGLAGEHTNLIWGGKVIVGSRDGVKAVDLPICDFCHRPFAPTNVTRRYCSVSHAEMAAAIRAHERRLQLRTCINPDCGHEFRPNRTNQYACNQKCSERAVYLARRDRDQRELVAA